MRTLIRWLPRAMGIATALFLALFALDALTGPPWLSTLAGFAIHLIPAALVGIVVAVAWRYPWVGAVVFTLFAAAYASEAREHPDWVLVISGPLIVTAGLFTVSGIVQTRERRAARAA